EAFALAREAARRVLGERSFDTQVLGGIVLHDGKIVEMKTGEGKTLSSVAAAYLNSLEGKGVHVVTVNDYLAERDSRWMGSIYSYLGVSVGAILSDMDNDARRAAYAKDITYGTNNEFGFDYLRDNMAMEPSRRVQRGHHYCVVDEIDSILIDEARTPLIISGAAEDDTFKINEVSRLCHHLVEVKKDPETGEYPKEEEGEALDGDYKIDEKSKKVSFTSDGLAKMEDALKKRGLIQGSLFDEQNFEYVHYFTQAVRARELFTKDTEYVVQEGLVQIVDEFTGRILHGRRYSDGLHEAIEAKERIKIARRNRTLATITFQNYFRMYDKIAGMTGTAETESVEFQKIYELDVVVIPTNKPVARLDEDDLVFLNESEKFEAICDEIAEAHAKGQPMLVGTVSIDKSERLSAALTRRGVRHEVLNAKNHAREATIIAEAGAKGAVTIATNMAGRGTDIKLGGNPEYRARKKVGTSADERTYREALEKEYELWRADYEEVKAAGGLYVLGTERHESRRIDNQLRGRSGRLLPGRDELLERPGLPDRRHRDGAPARGIARRHRAPHRARARLRGRQRDRRRALRRPQQRLRPAHRRHAVDAPRERPVHRGGLGGLRRESGVAAARALPGARVPRGADRELRGRAARAPGPRRQADRAPARERRRVGAGARAGHGAAGGQRLHHGR
ncbi:MAG TPA: preprotein translocase subunit SecA, partial [Spirochaetales bacterium]|nr:preprotein translocase subunit SecA [Spirochaetales bacterium]